MELFHELATPAVSKCSNLALKVYDFPEDWTHLELYPINDLHVGDMLTDYNLFATFKKFILAKPNRFVILVGDLINNTTRGSVGDIYHERMNPQEQKKWVKAEFRELAPRILGITKGNHENRSAKESGCEITEDIADDLGLSDRYQPNGLFIKMSVGSRTATRKCTYTLYATHGAGGGAQIGSAVNRLENHGQSFEGVDIFVMGHVHGKNGNRGSKIVVDPHNNSISQKDILYVISPAWQAYGGYAQTYMLRPRPRGASPILLSGKMKYFCTLT